MAARFADRRDAGRLLARRLRALFREPAEHDIVVLGLPRGGVVVAAEVARALGAPLDVIVTRTVSAPGNEAELGAMADDDPPLFNRRAMRSFGVTGQDLADAVTRERVELHRLERLYRQHRPALPLEGRTVVLVADGLTAGPAAHAAVRTAAGSHPARLVLAAPVCDLRLVTGLRRDVDDFVCLYTASYLHAVGPWYGDFREVGDREVAGLLAQRSAVR